MFFKEFTNPEAKDYDIYMSHSFREKQIDETDNQYINELINLIGILEDINEVDLFNTYGITLNEYYNPTEETIKKIKNKLGINDTLGGRK